MPSLRPLALLIPLTMALTACASGPTSSAGQVAPLADTGGGPPPGGATPSPEGPAGSQQIELRLDVAASAFDGAVRLLWTGLADSRCPTGVQCIWAGEVTATVTVTRDGAAPVEVSVTHPGDAVTAHGYEIRLAAVTPHPRNGVEVARSEHRARVTVVRK